jgi:hypothetical protein
MYRFLPTVDLRLDVIWWSRRERGDDSRFHETEERCVYDSFRLPVDGRKGRKRRGKAVRKEQKPSERSKKVSAA